MSVFNILYSTNIKERLNKIDFKFMKLPLTPNDCRIQKIKKRRKKKMYSNGYQLFIFLFTMAVVVRRLYPIQSCNPGGVLQLNVT